MDRGEDIDLFLKGDIIYAIYKAETITKESIDKAIKRKLEITQPENKEFKMFSDITRVKVFTREARQRLADEDSASGITVVSVLMKSKLHEVIFNFFNKVYRAPKPTKMFTDQEKALEWLRNYPDV